MTYLRYSSPRAKCRMYWVTGLKWAEARNARTRRYLERTALLGVVVTAMTILPGCAVTIPLGGPHSVHVSAPEQVFQALNAVDFSTTVSTARKPACYDELGIPTEAIIGKHPSVAGVGAYWAAYSALHLVTSSWLDREVEATDSKAWRVVRIVWYATTIADSAYAVERNWRIGLRPFQGAGGCAVTATQGPAG